MRVGVLSLYLLCFGGCKVFFVCRVVLWLGVSCWLFWVWVVVLVGGCFIWVLDCNIGSGGW